MLGDKQTLRYCIRFSALPLDLAQRSLQSVKLERQHPAGGVSDLCQKNQQHDEERNQDASGS